MSKEAFAINTQPGLSLLAVSGEECRHFLNSISTAEVADEGYTGAQPNALCNIKGRIISLYYLIDRAPGYWMVLPSTLKDRIVKLLNMYRLRAKVTIEPATDATIATLTQIPTGATDLDAEDNFPASAIPDGTHGDMLAASVGRRIPRSLLIGNLDQAEQTISQLTGNGHKADNNDAWRLAAIIDGQPWIESAQSEKYLAQTLDLDRAPLSVCSLSKGCYPGQEIIARMHYLGKRKRGLFWCTGPAPLSPGQSLYNAPSTTESKGAIGTVLDSITTTSEHSQTIALAELSLTTSQEPNSIYNDDSAAYTARHTHPIVEAPA
ncbi:MAG: hypothetical protein K8963_09865 [Proteobacteria bacterium]|nr:hypothetical protein [Pseudomonadota bacterium]